MILNQRKAQQKNLRRKCPIVEILLLLHKAKKVRKAMKLKKIRMARKMEKEKKMLRAKRVKKMKTKKTMAFKEPKGKQDKT